jgi:hypothetical protein
MLFQTPRTAGDAQVFEDEQVDAGELLDEITAGAGRVRLGESAAKSKVLRASARRPARMAPTAMAEAMCDLPTPGGPISSRPSWAWTNRALANSTIFAFGIFGLKDQSKSASAFTTVMPACLRRRANSRSARRAADRAARAAPGKHLLHSRIMTRSSHVRKITPDIELRRSFRTLWALRCKVAARRGVYSFDVSDRRS